MRTRRIVTLLGAFAVAGGTLTATAPAVPVAAQGGLVAQAEHGTLKIHTIPAQGGGQKLLPSISGAVVTGLREAYLEQQATGLTARQAATASNGQAASGAGIVITPGTNGCGQRNPDDGVRVNQDCTFRRQAEEVIKYNPSDPTNLVAGQNDSRIGYNHCGIDYSLNSGQTWGDMLPPFWLRENHPEADGPVAGDNNTHSITSMPGSDATYDFASDPGVAVDSQGRAFFSCVVISLAANEGDGTPAGVNATGLLVTATPPNVKGSFYNNVPAGDTARAGQHRYVVVEDNDPNIFHDKPFIAADFYANSPNRDDVYATWTVFKSDPAMCTGANVPFFGCSPIYGSMSTDHGQHWSTPEEISGTGPMCTSFALDKPSACNQDQGSDPVVLPNGNLVVTFNNGNTPSTVNQQLAVVCQPSGSSPDGTAHLNCGAPAMVGQDVTTGAPLCNFGRGPEECIPGAFIRTNDFPRIAVNRDNGHVFVTWQDYRNGEFDIQLAESTDGGVTWSDATAQVNRDTGASDHYFPAIDTASSPAGNGRKPDNSAGQGNAGGDHVAVSYYRTDRVPNETTVPAAGFAPGVNPGVQQEFSDYVVSGGRGLHTPYDFRVVSPRFVPPDGGQAGFNGDYSGLTVVNSTAHPIWSDTRNASPYPPSSPDFQGVMHDEDIFTVAVPVPGGEGGD